MNRFAIWTVVMALVCSVCACAAPDPKSDPKGRVELPPKTSKAKPDLDPAKTPAGYNKTTPQDELKLTPDKTLALWPDRPLPKDLRQHMLRKNNVTRITKVSAPLIEVYLPKSPKSPKTPKTPKSSAKSVDAKPTPAVMVCPGGGYSILAYDLEGTEICKWLNDQGIAAVLLRYTVPRKRDEAFKDAQRAMGLIRHNAKAWSIAPDQIGMIGFSAGGHLTAQLSMHSQTRTYKSIDAADTLSCRPDFSILIYPAYLAQRGRGTKAASRLPVDAKTPPAFIAQSLGDRNHVGSSRAYAAALKKAGVSHELHLYKDGGHGYGMRSPKTQDASAWPDQCAKWIKTVLKK